MSSWVITLTTQYLNTSIMIFFSEITNRKVEKKNRTKLICKEDKILIICTKTLSKSLPNSVFYRESHWIQGKMPEQKHYKKNSNYTKILRTRQVEWISKDVSSRLQPLKAHAVDKQKDLPKCVVKMRSRTLRSLLVQKILTVSCPSDCQGIKAMKRCECSWANRIKDG